MGRFLNKGNGKFERFSKTRYFVDKTELINKLLEKDETEKFICNSRARRFGKSVTADMLVAYFSKGADSKDLFEPFRCVKDAAFLENMNHFDTIFMDVQAMFVEAREAKADPNEYICRNIIGELRDEYPELVSEQDTLAKALNEIYCATGDPFVVIFDEWDYPVRELDPESGEREQYIEFLRGLFKNSDAKDYIRLAYLTGIMPIVRVKGQSAVNNFVEYTMTNSKDFGQYIGFTENEVQMLCTKHGADFDKMKEWYNGYKLGGEAIYNPLSVVRAISDGDYAQHWTATGTYGDIEELINQNFDGLREMIIRMLSGNKEPIRVSDGKNDLRTFANKDEVVTALIHLGYFAYDKDVQEAYVPNQEIREVFYHYMENDENDALSRFMEQSEKIFKAVLAMEEEQVGVLVQGIHNDFISAIEYNDENSLSCTIMMAMIASFRYYHKPIREFPCGKGFADIVYLPLPRYPNMPAIVVELKWNKSAEAAIGQIKERQYPASLKEYAGEILLVGIDYDKKAKEHRCVMEKENGC